jgi:hypothetical protein
MSFLRDTTVVPIACQQHQKRPEVPLWSPIELARPSHRRKYTSVPSLSSIVWGSVIRAGNALGSLREVLTRDDRDVSLRIEDRKKTLYLRLENVISFSFLFLGLALFSLLRQWGLAADAQTPRLPPGKNGLSLHRSLMDSKATISGRPHSTVMTTIQFWSRRGSGNWKKRALAVISGP